VRAVPPDEYKPARTPPTTLQLLHRAGHAGKHIGAPTYRFVRRYLERRPQPQLTLRQVDPLIRELTHYRDHINNMTKETG
jgi:hypothetical protein